MYFYYRKNFAGAWEPQLTADTPTKSVNGGVFKISGLVAVTDADAGLDLRELAAKYPVEGARNPNEDDGTAEPRVPTPHCDLSRRGVNSNCKIERASSLLDTILGHTFPVLDHGFVRVVDYMGNDDAIVQMARVSYGDGTRSRSDDRGVLRYLMRHDHTSPFEGCEIKLHVKLPIFIARQWIRHRTANVNEYSGRYSILKDEFFVPDEARLGRQSVSNKQGTGEGYPAREALAILDLMQTGAADAFEDYKHLISDEVDLARELARINLPLSTYTEWYWKIDLHNLFHFLRLRADLHAQKEIRDYAAVIEDIVKLWVPAAFEAYVDYRRDAVKFSRMEVDLIRELLGQMPFNQREQFVESLKISGSSDGEVKEFAKKAGWASL